MSAPHLGVVPAADTHLSLSLSLSYIARPNWRYEEENASAENVDDELRGEREICLERGRDRSGLEESLIATDLGRTHARTRFDRFFNRYRWWQ